MISLPADEIITFSKDTGSKVLDLNGKNLTKIPKKVFTIKNIEYLYLQENKITNILIADLKYLDVIALNDLTILPCEILKLKNLIMINGVKYI